jgi:hypothetical protein
VVAVPRAEAKKNMKNLISLVQLLLPHSIAAIAHTRICEEERTKAEERRRNSTRQEGTNMIHDT